MTAEEKQKRTTLKLTLCHVIGICSRIALLKLITLGKSYLVDTSLKWEVLCKCRSTKESERTQVVFSLPTRLTVQDALIDSFLICSCSMLAIF